VFAQLSTLFINVSWIPAFSQWHSAAMPYPILLLSQLIIIGYFLSVVWQFSNNTFKASSTKGIWFIRFGIIYFVVMLIRYLLGLTLFYDLRWFTQTLPIVFHFVLAGLVLFTGAAHITQHTGISR
jgi:phosphatidylglycerophosphate synthase